MKKNLDVMAVMNRDSVLAYHFRLNADAPRVAEEGLVNAEEARAAVTELIEALEQTDIDFAVLLNNISDAQCRDPKWEGMYEIVMRWKARNRAALARVKGVE